MRLQQPTPTLEDSIFDLEDSLLYFAAAKDDQTAVRLIASLSGASASTRYEPRECTVLTTLPLKPFPQNPALRTLPRSCLRPHLRRGAAARACPAALPSLIQAAACSLAPP